MGNSANVFWVTFSVFSSSLSFVKEPVLSSPKGYRLVPNYICERVKHICKNITFMHITISKRCLGDRCTLLWLVNFLGSDLIKNLPQPRWPLTILWQKM